MTTNRQAFLFWLLRIIAATILLQTLFFKFTGAEEAVYIFYTLGLEPVGRIGLGIAELIAAVLILYPRTTGIGALMALCMMAGDIFFHFTKLGIEVRGDGGLLFLYAVIVFVSSAVLLIKYHHHLFGLFRQKAAVSH